MKKTILAGIIAVTVISTGYSLSLTETARRIDDTTMKNAFGRYKITAKVLNNKEFGRYISLLVEDIADSGYSREREELFTASVKKYSYMKKRYLMFEIRHGEPIRHVHGSTRMELVDLSGNSGGRVVLDAFSLETGGRKLKYSTFWLFKTDKPLTGILVLKLNFMPGQYLEYRVNP